MLRHVVLLKWKEGTSEQAIDNLTAEFSKLPVLIPQIRSFSFGPSAGIYKESLDYALVADFESEIDFKTYVMSEAHQVLMKNFTSPILDSYHATQFEVR